MSPTPPTSPTVSTPPADKREIALVLAGGIAKGAFEAGAIEVIARSRVTIRRIVAASSGALNATILGAAIRQGDVGAGAARLVDLWRDRASWSQIFDFSLSDLAAGRAVSSPARVLQLLRDETGRQLAGGRNPIALRFLQAVLEGVKSNIGPLPATTFEAATAFEGADYDDPARREQLLSAAMGSSAFPFLFAPRELQLDGRTVHVLDGGVVNNTPVRLALRDRSGDSGLSTVVVVTPYPRVITEPPSMGGLALASDIIEMLIEERLYRDLREVERVNAVIREVESLAGQGFSAMQLEHVRAIALQDRRRVVQAIQVRPEHKLAGNAFSAFFDAGMRRDYLAAGRAAAEQALQTASLL